VSASPWIARLRDDTGAAGVEAVILYPVVLLLIFAIIQGGIVFHARNVARSAANGAVLAAQTEDGSNATGVAEANARLARAGDAALLAGANVQVDRGANQVNATVSGQALSIVPGLAGITVSATASGAVEHFSPAGGP
jgi:Flp pilus assembly protein TadG